MPRGHEAGRIVGERRKAEMLKRVVHAVSDRVPVAAVEIRRPERQVLGRGEIGFDAREMADVVALLGDIPIAALVF